MACLYGPLNLKPLPLYKAIPSCQKSYDSELVSSYSSSPLQYKREIIGFGAEASEIDSLMQRYNSVKSDCFNYMQRYSSTSPSKLELARLVHEYVQSEVYKNNYSAKSSNLEGLLKGESKGNCLSVTSLFYLLVKELVGESDGFKISIATPNGHIAALIKSHGREYFVENTIREGFDINFDESFVEHIGRQAETAILAALFNNKAASASTLDEALNYYKEALNYNSNMTEVYKNIIGISERINDPKLAEYKERLAKISRRLLVSNKDSKTYKSELHTFKIDDVVLSMIGSKPLEDKVLIVKERPDYSRYYKKKRLNAPCSA